MMVNRDKRFEWDIKDLDFFDAAGKPFNLEKRSKESKEKLTGKDVLPQPPEEKKKQPLKEEKEA